MEENNELINNSAVEYTDDNIRHLSDMEHVRTRPGMLSSVYSTAELFISSLFSSIS